MEKEYFFKKSVVVETTEQLNTYTNEFKEKTFTYLSFSIKSLLQNGLKT